MSSIQINAQLTAATPLKVTTTTINTYSTIATATINAAHDSLFANAIAGTANGAPRIHGLTKDYIASADKLIITLFYSET